MEKPDIKRYQRLKLSLTALVFWNHQRQKFSDYYSSTYAPSFTPCSGCLRTEQDTEQKHAHLLLEESSRIPGQTAPSCVQLGKRRHVDQDQKNNFSSTINVPAMKLAVSRELEYPSVSQQIRISSKSIFTCISIYLPHYVNLETLFSHQQTALFASRLADYFVDNQRHERHF